MGSSTRIRDNIRARYCLTVISRRGLGHFWVVLVVKKPSRRKNHTNETVHFERTSQPQKFSLLGIIFCSFHTQWFDSHTFILKISHTRIKACLHAILCTTFDFPLWSAAQLRGWNNTEMGVVLDRTPSKQIIQLLAQQTKLIMEQQQRQINSLRQFILNNGTMGNAGAGDESNNPMLRLQMAAQFQVSSSVFLLDLYVMENELRLKADRTVKCCHYAVQWAPLTMARRRRRCPVQFRLNFNPFPPSPARLAPR